MEFGPNVGLALLGVESQICADDTLMDEKTGKALFGDTLEQVNMGKLWTVPSELRYWMAILLFHEDVLMPYV